jgi:hypothetical protein
MTPSRRVHDLVDHLSNSLASKTRYWWALLIVGVIWIVIRVAIPHFAYAAVATLAKLVGVFCLAAAANEVMVGAMMSSRGGRIPRGLLAVVFVVAGVVAFLGVKATIVGLGAVMSVLFICWGCSQMDWPAGRTAIPTSRFGASSCTTTRRVTFSKSPARHNCSSLAATAAAAALACCSGRSPPP